MTFALVLCGLGLATLWLAIKGWHQNGKASISLLEAAILKATGAEPLPLTRWDLWFQRIHLVAMSIFGSLMAFFGGYAVLSEMGVL